MHKIHRTLHLQHHKHTGHLLHHRHTSYRGLAVVFVLAGLSIIGLNALSKATADTMFGVSGMVLPPVPTAAATIAVPSSVTTVHTDSTDIAGSCPVTSPQVVIALLVDSNQVGSSVCDASNDFVGRVPLTPGSHNISAQVYTIGGQAGKVSNSVDVTYTPTGVATTAATLSMSSGQALSYISSDNTATWTGTIQGGTPPYTVSAAWDDGMQETFDVAAAGQQQFSHTYSSLGSHNIVFAVRDSAGNTYNTQFAAATLTDYTPVAATTPNHQSFSASSMFGLYGLFLTTLAITGILAIESRKVRKEHRFA